MQWFFFLRIQWFFFLCKKIATTEIFVGENLANDFFFLVNQQSFFSLFIRTREILLSMTTKKFLPIIFIPKIIICTLFVLTYFLNNKNYCCHWQEKKLLCRILRKKVVGIIRRKSFCQNIKKNFCCAKKFCTTKIFVVQC